MTWKAPSKCPQAKAERPSLCAHTTDLTSTMLSDREGMTYTKEGDDPLQQLSPNHLHQHVHSSRQHQRLLVWLVFGTANFSQQLVWCNASRAGEPQLVQHTLAQPEGNDGACMRAPATPTPRGLCINFPGCSSTCCTVRRPTTHMDVEQRPRDLQELILGKRGVRRWSELQHTTHNTGHTTACIMRLHQTSLAYTCCC